MPSTANSTANGSGSGNGNDNDSDDAPLSFKGMKTADVKKIQKEMARAEKKAAKDKEKKAIAERKRQRGKLHLDLMRLLLLVT